MVRNQTIYVHCGCGKNGGGCGTCKKKRRRVNKRGGANSNTRKPEAPPNFNPIHTLAPVYIQSGNPPPEPNPLLRAVQDLKERVDTHHDYYRNELRHRVHNVDRGHIAEPRKEHKVMETQTDLDEIPPSSPYHRESHHRGFSQPKSAPKSLDFEEDNPMYSATQMFRRSLSTPPIDRHVNERPSPARDTHVSDSEINMRPTQIPVRSGRQARPQGSDESDERYEARMERNKIAREKASADRRNRNTSYR